MRRFRQTQALTFRTMHGNLTQLQRSPRDVVRWQNAQQQLLGGQSGPALTGYRVLVRRYPAVAELWFELGNAAAGELDFAQANEAYRRALAQPRVMPPCWA